MAIFSGPEIVQNGLVLALDAANARSFRGEPTTNIISNGDFSNGLTDWTNYTAVTTSVVTRYDVPGYLNQPKTVARVVSPGTVQGGGTFGGFARSVTMTSGLAYTISYYARSLSGNMTLGFNSQSGSGDTNNLSHSNTINATWQRYTFTATLNTAKPTMYIYNSGTANGIWELTDFQIEQKSYATAFVNGTRGTTVATGGGWSDTSGNFNEGELFNGASYNSGNLGGVVLDGTDDYVSIPNSSSLNISSAITLEAWIYPTKNTGVQNVISKSTNAVNNGYIYPRTDNGWTASIFYLQTASGWNTLSATWPSLNSWHYTAATYDGSTQKIYINGQLSASRNQTGTITTNSNSLVIGNQPGFAEYYGGRVSQVKIYNRSLTASEILQNYNATRSRYGF